VTPTVHCVIALSVCYGCTVQYVPWVDCLKAQRAHACGLCTYCTLVYQPRSGCAYAYRTSNVVKGSALAHPLLEAALSGAGMTASTSTSSLGWIRLGHGTLMMGPARVVHALCVGYAALVDAAGCGIGTSLYAARDVYPPLTLFIIPNHLGGAQSLVIVPFAVRGKFLLLCMSRAPLRARTTAH